MIIVIKGSKTVLLWTFKSSMWLTRTNALENLYKLHNMLRVWSSKTVYIKLGKIVLF